MYFYVYKIIKISNGMYYIGSRGSNIEPLKDLGIKYFSSSRNKEFIKEQKANPKNFLYEVLEVCSSRKEAFEKEAEYQTKYKCGEDVFCYNKAINAIGFTSYGRKVTQETRNKLSQANKGKSHPAWNKGLKISPEQSQKLSDMRKGKPQPWHKGKKLSEKQRKNISLGLKEYFKTHDNVRKGCTLSPETKELLRQQREGKNWEDLYGEEKAKTMKEHLSLKTKNENNPMFGKKHCDSSKKLMSERAKGRKRSDESIAHQKETIKNKRFVTCPYCGLCAKQSPDMERYHFENCKLKKRI